MNTSTSSTYEPKFNPKKHSQHRRVRPEVHPSIAIGTSGPNHTERRKLKARERLLPSFSKATKARYIKDIQEKEHREALKRRLIKKPKKSKVPFISKRSLKNAHRTQRTII